MSTITTNSTMSGTVTNISHDMSIDLSQIYGVTTTGTSTSSTGSISYGAPASTGRFWISDSTISSTFEMPPLYVKGKAVLEGDVEFEGKDLGKRLETIERRLAILNTNQELELRWDDLRVLGDKYRELEREILEKERIVDILSK